MPALVSFRRLFLLFSFPLLLLSSCNEPSPSSRLAGFVSAPDDHWAERTLTVCFEQERGFELDKKTVKEAVTSQFASLGFQFVGWQLCKLDQKGIRIRFDPNASQSRTEGFGRRNDGVIAGLTLGLAAACAEPFSGSSCEANLALHEFGHVLGLHHEMNRRDDPGCFYRQFDAASSENATQIGPYDSDSVMNYCRLYAANEKGERISLSAGDQKTLRALYEGPLASFEPLLPYVIENNMAVAIKAENIASFRYALGSKGQLNCQDPAAYGPSQPPETLIELDPQLGEKGILTTLCVLARDESGREQPLDAYTSTDFFLQDASPSLADGPRFSAEPNFQLDAEGRPTLALKLDHATPLRAIGARLSYQEGRPFSAPVISSAHPEADAEGRYILRFKREDFPVNGTVYVSSVYATDIYGRNQSLMASADEGTFIDSPWKVARLPIDFARPRAPSLPDLFRIDVGPDPFRAGDKRSMTLQFSAPVELALVRLTFATAGGNVIPSVRLLPSSGNSVELSMSFPIDSPNGNYRLARISLEDRSGNTRTQFLPAEGSLPSGLSTFSRTLDGGQEVETEGPEFQSWLALPESFRRGENPLIDLLISDSSPIAKVGLKLKHEREDGLTATIYGIDLGEVAGRRRILLNAEGSHPSGRYYLAELLLEDRWGNQRILSAERGSRYFSGTGLAVPQFLLNP